MRKAQVHSTTSIDSQCSVTVNAAITGIRFQVAVATASCGGSLDSVPGPPSQGLRSRCGTVRGGMV